MATTRLSDIYVAEPFDRHSLLATKTLSAMFRSGIVTDSPKIREFAQGPGKIFDMPKLNDLGDTESNIGDDNPANTSTPQKVGTATDQAVKHYRNQSWSETDLVSSITDPKDPLGALSNRIGAYWERQYQKILINSLKGVLADNEANDSSDMVYSVATDATGTPAAAEKVSHSTITQARLTMGDALDDLVAIGMHSTVYGTLLENDNIDFVEDSEANFRIPRYGNLFVIVDDNLPAVSGTNRITYTSVLFGRGAFGYGEGAPKTPSEIEREPSQGNGEGVEILYSRRHLIMHPMGIKFTNTSVASTSPTFAELAAAANWDRVYPERKQIPLAFMKTNG